MHSTTSNSGFLVFVSLLSAFLAGLKVFGPWDLSWLWVLFPLAITAFSVPVLFGIIALRNLWLRSRKAGHPPGRIARWKKWYDALGNHPFVP